MSGLPAGWRAVTLGELAAVEPGSITDGPFGSNLTSAHYVGKGARVIRLENIGDGHFRDARSFVRVEHFERLRKHEARPGDLVVASLGDGLPRACLVPDLGGPALVKADCIRIRLRPDVNPKWALYAMQAPNAKRWAADRLRGVGRQRLGLKGIREIPVNLPPLDEQNRIVAVLEDHMSRLDAASDYLRAVATRTATWRRSALDAEVARTSPSTAALGDLVQRVEAGRSFGGAAAPAREDEWGVIRVSAMTWGEFRPEENKAVPENMVDPRYEIREGDVLVSRANTTAYVGAPVLVGKTRPKLLLSDKSLRLVPKPQVDPAWLVEVLGTRPVRRQLSALATGTKDSMRNISQANLLSARVPLAPRREQQRLRAAAVEINADADRLRVACASAEARQGVLTARLLHAAFTGQL